MKQHLGYTRKYLTFLNLCVENQTTLTVYNWNVVEDRKCLHRIEKERWGPRTFEILRYVALWRRNEWSQNCRCHVRMNERAFVLIPLNPYSSKYHRTTFEIESERLVFVDDSVKRYK